VFVKRELPPGCSSQAFFWSAFAVKPNLLALIVADNVYRDGRTGKHIISGTFDKLFFSRTNLNQPMVVDGKPKLMGGMDSGSPYAYLCLTNVRGDTKLMLRYVDLGDNSQLFEGEIRVTAQSPLDTVEAILPLPRLPVPHPGMFALELLYEDEPVGLRRITVEELPTKPDGTGTK
jgi:hypothetical protein